ncbi:MAG: DMT family transporter, partial [Leptospiraceae bacterium]|nr:DMT family transporter [Leptospiraceae bacterium]
GREVLHTQPVLGTTTVACMIGAGLLFPAGSAEWMMEGPRSLGFLIAADNALVWLHLMYLGFFASGVAFLFWYQGVRALGAPRASVFINLVPVFAMLISIFMGKWPAPYQWSGAAVVLFGVYITSRSGQSKAAS